jgi:hypothetical protein
VSGLINDPVTEQEFRAVAQKAFVDEQPCELATYHEPKPVMTEYHHSKPVFLQNRLYGRIKYGPDLWVCGNCHDAIHAWLYWLLGERRQPTYIGRLAKREAERTYEWYLAELAAR